MITIKLESQEQVNAFELILSESMKSGNLSVAGAVSHFHEKLIRSVQESNKSAIAEKEAAANPAKEAAANPAKKR